MKSEVEIRALENCYFVLTRSLQLKSRSCSRSGRLEPTELFVLVDAHPPRLKLNSDRSAMNKRVGVPCQKVGARIVPATAKRAGGLCMKCKANGTLW